MVLKIIQSIHFILAHKKKLYEHLQGNNPTISLKENIRLDVVLLGSPLYGALLTK